jgi:hypothetical protein
MPQNIEHYFSSTDPEALAMAEKMYNNLYDFYRLKGKEVEIERGESFVRLVVHDTARKAELNRLPPRCEACGE